MKREVVVSSIGFDESGIELAYMVLPDDVRSEGHLVVSRSLAISFQAAEGLGAMATDITAAITELASRAHEKWDDLPVYEPPAAERLSLLPFPDDDDDDEDEDIGMGDGR